jgi:hypothetical protein
MIVILHNFIIFVNMLDSSVLGLLSLVRVCRIALIFIQILGFVDPACFMLGLLLWM